jgi:hypothetical protein
LHIRAVFAGYVFDFSRARGSVASGDARKAGIFAGAASGSEDVISVGLGIMPR